MHRLLLSEAGGALTNGMIASLRMPGAGPHYLVGVSSDVYALHLAATDQRYLVPEADEPGFIEIVNDLCRRHDIELIVSQHDVVVAALSEQRHRLAAPVFLPDHEVVQLCQDKSASNERWAAAGLKVPRAILLNDIKDLDRAFNELGNRMWLRATHGGYGKGAIPVGTFGNRAKDFRFAKLWVDANDGWGKFHIAEALTPRSVTWLSIWKDGELVVAQGRSRHYWKYHNRNLSGVTGITGVGETVSDTQVDEIALQAIAAIDPRPQGVYSVDMTYDMDGVPNPTEINIGRFFTTHRFFAAAGLNVSEMLVRTFFNEPLPSLPRRVNPLEPGLTWAREMDSEPALIHPHTVEQYRNQLEAQLAETHSFELAGRY